MRQALLLSSLLYAAVLTCSAQQLQREAEISSPVEVKYATTCNRGNRILAIGNDGVLYGWRKPFGDPERIQLSNKPQYLACSKDGKSIAVGLRGGNVVILNEIGQVQQTLQITKHDLQGLALSPDGSLLGAAANDSPTQLWDVRTGRKLATGSTVLGASTAVAFAPDSRSYISADEDTRIRGYDRDGKELFTTHADLLEPFAAGFLPDGKRFAVAGAGGTITLFDANSGKRLNASPTNGNPIFNMVVAPTGEQIAVLELDDFKLEPVAISTWDTKATQMKKLDVDVKTVVGAGSDATHLLLIRADAPGKLSLWSIH